MGVTEESEDLWKILIYYFSFLSYFDSDDMISFGLLSVLLVFIDWGNCRVIAVVIFSSKLTLTFRHFMEEIHTKISHFLIEARLLEVTG